MRKIITAVLSLLAAFALWTYVITVVSPESEATFSDIPVTFQNETALEDRGLMVMMDKTPTVTLKLVGNRSDLNKLSSSNITVTVDLSRIYEEGTTQASYTVSYPGDVANNAFTIQSRQPASIELEVVRREKKTIPVVPVFDKELVPADYYLDEVSQDLEEITIYGPASKLEKITQACINVDLTGKTETFTVEDAVTLCDAAGQPVDSKYVTVPKQAENISVTMVIYRAKTVPVWVEVIPGGGATEENTVITLSQETITVYGRDSLLSEMEEYVITIDLNELEEDSVLSHQIQLPAGLSCADPDPAEIQVTVDLPELETKVLIVKDIRPVNIPVGMTADILGQLTVTVRGPASQIRRLTAADLIATVDFTGASVGNNKRAVLVTVSDEYPGVVVVGTYEILTSVEKDTSAT